MRSPGAGRPRSRTLVATLACSLLLGIRCTPLSREELACEDAVARLASCCRGIDTRAIFCGHAAGSCEEGTAHPVIPPGDAECLARMSCESMVAAGTCDRARVYQLGPATGVCP